MLSILPFRWFKILLTILRLAVADADQTLGLPSSMPPVRDGLGYCRTWGVFRFRWSPCSCEGWHARCCVRLAAPTTLLFWGPIVGAFASRASTLND